MAQGSEGNPGDQGQQPSRSIEDFYEQYRDKLQKQLDPTGAEVHPSEKLISKEYIEFKEQYIPKQFSIYEKACNYCEKLVRIAPDKNKAIELQESINICHLDMTPVGVMSFSILFPVAYMMLGIILNLTIFPLLTGSVSMYILGFFVVTGAAMIVPLGNFPFMIANSWRLKESNQMVLCIFYVVSYMRHTSNLELAIKFTADHIAPPLSLDLKQILWNVETEKYESVKESFEKYMETWRKWNMEFIEAMHLIEASLYETSEERRIEELEKALSLILEETYEKMLHYAHDLQSPITMLHMLGIILPILGLVILPLVVSFMDEARWYHIALLYNVALPVAVFYLGKMILSKRPTGYGQADVIPPDAEKRYKSIIITFGKREILLSPMIIAVVVGSILFLIGISPILMHTFDGTKEKAFDVIIPVDEGKPPIMTITTFAEAKDAKFQLLGYRKNKRGTAVIGPFGLGATLLSLFVTMAFGVGIGLYYKLSTRKLIMIREQSKQLEAEFAAALFQLGSRIGDGIPAEIAFQKVAEETENTSAGQFFRIVSINISKMGLGIEKALFDPKVGAIVLYPSNLIQSSMEVFIEATKKGPKIASQALINISIYIKEMHAVDERLKDLLAETISSMNSQIKFLTPAISGIVIGITSMITTILGKLSQQIGELNSEAGGGGQMGIGTELITLFGDGVPTFYFQIIVGIYVVQIIYILTIIVNTIQNGVDPVNERYQIGNNLVGSTILFSILAFIVMMIFNLVAGSVLSGLKL